MSPDAPIEPDSPLQDVGFAPSSTHLLQRPPPCNTTLTPSARVRVSIFAPPPISTHRNWFQWTSVNKSGPAVKATKTFDGDQLFIPIPALNMPSGGYKVKFNDQWLVGKDVNTDEFSKYITRVRDDVYRARCLACNKSVQIGHQGRHALVQHAKGPLHKRYADLFFKRSTQQQISFNRVGQDETPDDSNPDEPEVEVLHVETNTSEKQDHQTTGPAEPRAADNNNRPFSVTVSKDVHSVPERHATQVSKAEIRILLASVEGNIGYNTLETFLPSLKMLDCKSKILQDITLNRTKASYSISDGIGPHFLDLNMQAARRSFGYSLSLDGATNKRMGLAKAVDFHVTFWDNSKGQVVEALLKVVELISETAEVLKNEILDALDNEGLKLNHLRALGRDSPNVNIRLVKLMKEEVEKKGGHLTDFGGCVLHIAHNSFEKGIHNLSVNIPMLCKCLFGFFKYSVDRRAKFSEELIDHDFEPANFKRHVSSRWLSLGPSALKVDKFYPAIVHYFLTTLPKEANEGDANAKTAVKSKYYELVVTELRKPACRTILKVVIHLCDKFSPFLHALQKGEPLIHTLYDSCMILFTAVLGCFIQSAHIPDDCIEVVKLDLKKNHKDSPLMSPSTKECFKELSQHVRNSVKKELFELYQTTAKYMQEKLHPLKSILVRHLRVLNPEYRKSSPDGGSESVIKCAKLMKCLSTAELDLLALQWDNLTQTTVIQQPNERIDKYYDRVLKDLEGTHSTRNFIPLRKFIQTALILPSQNSMVERGFSHTKRFLGDRESLSLKSLSGLKMTKEAIQYYGGSSKVPITSVLLAKQTSACATYRLRLDEERKSKKVQEEQDKAVREARRKRDAQEAEEAEFNVKRRKLETEETSLKKQIQYSEVMLEGMVDRAEKTSSLPNFDIEEIRAAQKSQKKQRETINALRNQLEEVRVKKDKLNESELKIKRRNKNKK